MTFEWATRVSVIREGNFTRTEVDTVDETEIFEGAENTLTNDHGPDLHLGVPVPLHAATLSI